MLHNKLSKGLVLTASLVVALGALGASQIQAEQARSRTSVSKSSKAGSRSDGATVRSNRGGRSRDGAGVTRSGDRSTRGHRDNRSHYGTRGRGHNRISIGLGYWGGWGGFYGRYGGYYYNPFYYGYPVYYSYHPSRFSDFGALDLNVRPKKTEVWVDGQYVGTAGRFDGYPGHLWLGDGRHELIFFHQGFATVRREVKVLEGVILDIAHRMEPGDSIPAEELSAFGQQDFREIEENRALREQQPAFEKRPRQPSSEVGEPGRRPLRNDAREEPGRLKLEIVPADASIYLDGRFLGSGQELRRLHSGLMVSPGEHTLEVVRPGFDSEQVPFSVESGEETSLRIDLEAARVGDLSGSVEGARS